MKGVKKMSKVKECTILVVDDTDSSRRFVAEVLQSVYNVLEADSGGRAIELLIELKTKGLSIDLMLSDLIMDISVITLRDKARELFPDLKIMYMSGSDDKDLLGPLGISEDDRRYLRKPIHQKILINRVREILKS